MSLEIFAAAVRKVHKGLVRNMVFSQISAIQICIHLLSQGKNIKSREIDGYKKTNPSKAGILQKQVNILEGSISHLKEALRTLRQYRKYTT